jgi:hypothetical protein
MKYIKSFDYYLSVLTMLSMISLSSFASTSDEGNIHIKGSSDVSFTGKMHALASATGTFSALHASIKNIKENDDGSIEQKVEHYIKLTTGGFFRTEDIALLKSIKGQNNKYQVNVAFKIVGASQELVGYENQTFKGSGIFDLSTGTGFVDYSGSLIRNKIK